MSGYKSDINNILSVKNMRHSKSYGIVLGGGSIELAEFLRVFGLHISTNQKDEISGWDYVVLLYPKISIGDFLWALSNINKGGIIIIQLTGGAKLAEEYMSMITNYYATKVTYEGSRNYIVVHEGVDYGN